VRQKDAKIPSTEHDVKKACSVGSKKTGAFASRGTGPLSHSASMEALSCLKDGRVIRLVFVHQSENDARPPIGKSSDRHGMAFAHSSLGLILVAGPACLLGRSPGQLVQGVARPAPASDGISCGS